jgi:hypothetical protein
MRLRLTRSSPAIARKGELKGKTRNAGTAPVPVATALVAEFIWVLSPWSGSGRYCRRYMRNIELGIEQ